MAVKEFPEAICMICGKICETWERVDIGMGEHELWCYCKECDAVPCTQGVKALGVLFGVWRHTLCWQKWLIEAYFFVY